MLDAATQGNEHTNPTNMYNQFPAANIHNPISSNLSQAGGTDLPDQGIVSQNGQVVPEDDDTLWDLIDYQPWLGWMRSDALTDNPAFN